MGSGKKIAPILEEPDSGFVMGESMDIVKKFDEDPAFGPQIFGPASGREDIKAWMKGVKDLLRLPPPAVHAGQPPRVPVEGLAGLLHRRAPGAPFRQARVE